MVANKVVEVIVLAEVEEDTTILTREIEMLTKVVPEEG